VRIKLQVGQTTGSQPAEFQHETLKEKDHFEDLGIDGNIILKLEVSHVIRSGPFLTRAWWVIGLRTEKTASCKEVTRSILNAQPRTTDKRWSFSLVVSLWLKSSHRKKQHFPKCPTGSRHAEEQ
jgi:hypothetical protein